MPKTPEYRQCRLRKTLSPTSCAVTVTYIPAKFARHGRVIKLQWEDGSWDDGWVVEQAAMMETLTSIKRAGADLILTYFAKDAARLLRSEA
ncbi:MAG: hypothetical protein IH991_07990 [Planctomycetes bacterium]|nr:hypothetical protein [Planctomycetota bacterium]